jgi:hypothetical protein
MEVIQPQLTHMGILNELAKNALSIITKCVALNFAFMHEFKQRPHKIGLY